MKIVAGYFSKNNTAFYDRVEQGEFFKAKIGTNNSLSIVSRKTRILPNAFYFSAFVVLLFFYIFGEILGCVSKFCFVYCII